MIDKTCTGCGETKPLDEYSRHPSGKHGRDSKCLACKRAYKAANRERIAAKQREWHVANRERISAKNREYYATNKERLNDEVREWRANNREHIAEYGRKYHAENRNSINAKARAYHAANREYRNERSREYKADKPQLSWESGYLRRAKEYGFEAVVEPFTREQLIARHGDQCYHCGDEWTELDHYPIPVALGGAHSLENCVPSCTKCNRSQTGAIKKARKEMSI